MQIIKKIFIFYEKLKTICVAHAKKLPSECKKWKWIALPMQILKMICIAHANNEKDLHSQCKK